MRGPNPRANTYVVSGRRATVELTWKSFSIMGKAGVYIDDPRVLMCVSEAHGFSF
jgi:hypothetical protein